MSGIATSDLLIPIALVIVGLIVIVIWKVIAKIFDYTENKSKRE